MFVKIKAKIEWKYGRSHGGKYIAICPSLAQTVQADTFHELVGCITEAIDCTFEELVKSGDIYRFLKEHGWKAENAIPRRGKKVKFDVPFALGEAKTRDLETVLCA